MTTVMCSGLQLGLKLITLPKFEPEMYLKSLSKYKVFQSYKLSSHTFIVKYISISFFTQPTWLNLVPPIVSFLTTSPMCKPSHLASIKAVFGGAAPFGPALLEKFMEKAKPNEIKFREGMS